MASFLSECADVESLLRRPVESKVLSRWERKEQQAAAAAALLKTPARAASNGAALNSSVSSSSKTPGHARRSSLSLRTPGKPVVAPATPAAAASSASSSGDRFVPSRAAMEQQLKPRSLGVENDCAAHNHNNNVNSAENEKAHNQRLVDALFEAEDLNSKVLAFKAKAPKPSAQGHDNNLRVLYTQNQASFGRGAGANSNSSSARDAAVRRALLKNAPERVLDAPDLADDYYLNLLHWSAQNQLAVALGNAVYLWNADSGNINLLWESDLADEQITSVRWTGDGGHLAVGTSSHVVKVWDAQAGKCLRTMKGHSARVGSLSWNNHILTSGGRDAMIINHDVRTKQHKLHLLQGHAEEVCGLSWSPDGSQLASGANDNQCMIWDLSMARAGLSGSASVIAPRMQFSESQAAVKALAWSPHERHLLATGSGTADRHIRFYNTSASAGANALVNSIDTQSQVCSLQWAPRRREILSSHGFAQNQLAVWSYPSLALVGELKAHTARVLHTAVSPDGTTVCSAAADETLRFWNVWEPEEKKRVGVAASGASGFCGVAKPKMIR